MIKISDTAQLGKLIKQKRKEQGLNQKDFADAAGVGNRIVSEIERGKETAEVGKVLLLLKYAGLTVYLGDE